MESPYYRRGLAPWVWVLIVLGALLLVFIVWWAVAAQNQEQTVVVPNQPPTVAPPTVTTPPTNTQPQTTTPAKPTVVERSQPVNIYVERNQTAPKVIVVPTDKQPPEATNRLTKIDLPGKFKYQDQTWEPSDQAISGSDVNLKDSGASINGNVIYVMKDAQEPYNEVYLETNPGSGIYVKYIPGSS